MRIKLGFYLYNKAYGKVGPSIDPNTFKIRGLLKLFIRIIKNSLKTKRINEIQRIKNKWQFVFYFTKAYQYLPPKRVFIFGIFNIHTFPPKGVKLYNKYYKGFLLEYTFKRDNWKKIKKI